MITSVAAQHPATTTPATARLYPLALGTAAIGTSTHCVAGVMPTISAQLHVAPAVVGQLATVTAVACAVSGPILTVVTHRWDRRRLLVAALLVTALGNALGALAPTFPLLFAARVVTAVGMAIYIPAAVTMASTVTRPGRRARSMALVLSGLPIALVIGVPASNLLAEIMNGYHGVLLLVAGLSVVAAGSVALAAPTAVAPPAVSLRDRIAVAADRRVLLVVTVTTLAATATFAAYTYVVPILNRATTTDTTAIPWLLVAYGLGAVVGNELGGRASDRYGPQWTTVVAATGLSVLLLTFPITAATMPIAAVVMAAWGCAHWSANAPANAWLTDLAPSQAALAVSLNASAVYIGMGLGGVVGGVITATSDVLVVPVAAGGIAAGALGVVVVAITILRTRSTRPSPPATRAPRRTRHLFVVTRAGDDA